MSEHTPQQTEIDEIESRKRETELVIAASVGGAAPELLAAIKANAEKVGRVLSALLVLMSTVAIPRTSDEATATVPPKPQTEVMLYQANEVPANRVEEFNAIVSSLMTADGVEVK